ncbi:hypothetical protein O9992_22090 [Vibrio lentus]|nr:hypothetical protein [Vibrio lentus]
MGKQVGAKGTRLHVPDSRTRFDFGALIKEYAVDQAAVIGKQLGATSMLVNFEVVISMR